MTSRQAFFVKTNGPGLRQTVAARDGALQHRSVRARLPGARALSRSPARSTRTRVLDAAGRRSLVFGTSGREADAVFIDRWEGK
jgi:hypothetical protein